MKKWQILVGAAGRNALWVDFPEALKAKEPFKDQLETQREVRFFLAIASRQVWPMLMLLDGDGINSEYDLFMTPAVSPYQPASRDKLKPSAKWAFWSNLSDWAIPYLDHFDSTIATLLKLKDRSFVSKEQYLELRGEVQ